MKLGKLLVPAVIALFCWALPAWSHDQPADSPEQVTPLLVGAELPDVTLKTGEGAEVELAAAVGKKPAILIFYRGGW